MTAPARTMPKSRRNLPSRTVVNFWLDTLLLIIFLALIGCATITQFVFPPAANAGGWILWGMTFEQWRGIQFGIVCLLTIGVLVHVMLHWNWVCGVIFSRFIRTKQKPDEGYKTIYGVGLMIVVLNVLGLVIAAAVLTIRSPAI